MAFVDKALVLADHAQDIRVTVESGWKDERDFDALRFCFEVGSSHGELRLSTVEAKVLAKELMELAVGHPIKLTVRKARRE